MTRAAGALSLAVLIGAGLATGLARFPDPWSVAIALLAGATVTRRPAHLTLATACTVAMLVATLMRHDATRSCAARLPLGERTMLVRTIDPGHGAGRVVFPDLECVGAVAARWPSSAAVPAGMTVAVTARWLPRPGRLGRPEGLLLIRRLDAARGNPGWLDRSRTAVAEATARLFGDRAGLVDALIAGRRGGIDREVREQFVGAGMVHLLAISGFHVGLLAGWIIVLLRLGSVPARHAEPIAALVALCYAWWLGWPAPATRAAALVATAVLARRRQRAVRPDGLLGTSALVVMLVEPWSIVDLGAWLSFSAVAGVLWAVRWVRRAWPDRASWREPLAVSIGATLATAPIAALTIGRVATIGPIVNLVAIPLVAVTIPALLVAVVTVAIAPSTAAAFAASGSVLLGALEWLARNASTLPGAAGPADPGWHAALPWLAAAATAWWATRGGSVPREALRRVAWGTSLFVWWPLVATSPHRAVDPDRLTLHFLDVGQGDATAIRTPGGHWVVVDAGPADDRHDAGARVVTPFLERSGARRIALLVVSHGHRDHVGGAAHLVERWPVDLAIDPGEPFDEAGYLGWLERLSRRGVRWRTVVAGETWQLDGVQFRVLHPARGWSGAGRDLNEDSIVLEVRHGAFTALLGGDAGLPAESAFVPLLGQVDLLKVGHHGSRGATGVPLLARAQPRVAVVSSGRNRYGHPAPEALARLAAAGVAVLRTDREGTVSVSTDGRTFTVRGGRTVATLDARDPISEAKPCCTRPR